MKPNKKRLFGTSGIRGEVGSKINSQLALKVGKAVATKISDSNRKIVVGYDCRTSSMMLERAVTAGLLEGGCKVFTLGMVPTPVVGYATRKIGAQAGVMITASHNPSPDNGIKLWNSQGRAFNTKQEEQIEQIIEDENYYHAPWDRMGSIEDARYLIREYVHDLLELVDDELKLKVVVDCGCGAASYLSPLILRKAGCKVISLNCQPDGYFPGRNPEPKEANLQELMKTVKAVKADLGIAHDGDADRMVAVDDQGNLADFDKLLALIAQDAGGCVVTTVDASTCINKCMEKVAGRVINTKVGDVHVAEEVERHNASFGGEPSGTWIHPQFGLFPDGILSALRLVELVQKKETPLSELLGQVPDFPTRRGIEECEADEKEKIMEKVEREICYLFPEEVEENRTDGIRISTADGRWVLIRPSGTESYMRITLGGRTEEEADEMLIKFKDFLRRLK